MGILEASPGGSNLPDGMSMFELEERFKKWEWAHRALIRAVITHGLDLVTDTTNVTRKILYINMRPVDRTVHQDSARKYFEFVAAHVVDVKDAVTYDAPWPHIVVSMHKMQAEGLRAGVGLTAACVMEVEPLRLRALMADGLTRERLFGPGFKHPDPAWRVWLKHCINTGEK